MKNGILRCFVNFVSFIFISETFEDVPFSYTSHLMLLLARCGMEKAFIKQFLTN